MLPDWQALANRLQQTAAIALDGEPKLLSAGTWCAASDAGLLFIKTGSLQASERLAAEAEGLRELGAAATVRVPRVFAHGEVGQQAYLAIEWLSLERPTPDIDRLFGGQLAALHKVSAPAHGWHRNNTIGLTLQVNDRSRSWLTFFTERRLRFQLELAMSNGYRASLEALGERLMEALPELLDGHDPPPSLLHGDLWGGNYAACKSEPVIYDPAAYFGDRETDLAMTSLFGGFSSAFYDAYQKVWPLPQGYQRRCGLYQLYHVLNHLNLFGGGYLGQARALMLDALDHRA